MLAGLAREVSPRRCRRHVRVLVGYEDAYRLYGLVLAAAIEDSRPHLRVRSVALAYMGAELKAFEPHAVVCSHPTAEHGHGSTAAWLELPAEPNQPGYVCLGGEHELAVNADLTKVLGFLDEAEERLRRGALEGSC